jgi:hypothetical protein
MLTIQGESGNEEVLRGSDTPPGVRNTDNLNRTFKHFDRTNRDEVQITIERGSIP